MDEKMISLLRENFSRELCSVIIPLVERRKGLTLSILPA